MHWQRVQAIARKEFLHVWRDPRSLAMALAIPMLLLFLFGYALTLDVDRVPLAVWDQADTPASRALLARFTGSRYFQVRAQVTGYAALERALATREAQLALVIPPDLHRAPTTVQLLADGSDANTATIALGYARSVMRDVAADPAVVGAAAAAAATADAIELRPRVWYNPELRSRLFIVPGLIAVIMMIISALLTSLTVAREWERGTMETLLATPLEGAELVLGKLVPYAVIGMADLLLAVLLGAWGFAVPLRGSFALLLALAAVFLIGVLAMGILISIVTRSQLLATQLAMVLTFLPAFLLSGFMFAIDNMPHAVQVVTRVVPARYFVAALKALYLKGAGLRQLWPEALFLALFATVMLTLAIRRLPRQVPS